MVYKNYKIIKIKKDEELFPNLIKFELNPGSTVSLLVDIFFFMQYLVYHTDYIALALNTIYLSIYVI